MAHKTLIGGTAYEIKGGRTLVNGTGYDIKAGKTLVGGTAYDVSFGEPVTVNISRLTGTADVNKSYVEVNGVKYSGAKTGLQVMSGDTIKFYYSVGVSTYFVYINGVRSTASANAVWEWQVPSGIKTVSVEISQNTGLTFTISTSAVASAKVTITGSGISSYCNVTINGTKYSTATSNIVVNHGDTIKIRTRTNTAYDGQVYYIPRGYDSNYAITDCEPGGNTLNFVIPSVSNISIRLDYDNYGDGYCGNAFITVS